MCLHNTKNNSTNFKTSLQSITSTVTAMQGIKAGAYIGSNGLFDSATVNAYRASIKGLSATQAEAALSASGLSAAQRQQILTSKESTVANAGQATSFNVLTKTIWANIKAMAKWLVTTPTGWITLAIGATVGLIAAYNNVEKKQNELIENAHKLQEEYRSSAKSLSDNISSLESQTDEFERLSKGVNDYGKNISLSSDEYDRYKSIVAEILGYSPELIQGYDAEGNAIANKNSLIERSIELMKEEQRQKLKEMTTDEKTKTAYEGAKAGWQQTQGYEGANTRNDIANFFGNHEKSSGFWVRSDIVEALGLQEEWDNFRSEHPTRGMDNFVIENIEAVTKAIKNNKQALLDLTDAKGKKVFTSDEIEEIIGKADTWQQQYADWQRDIEDAKHGMDDQFELYAQKADGYNDLTDAQKAFVNEYIKATGDIIDADGNLLSEDEIIKKAEGYTKFVEKLATDPNFEEARTKINTLFSLDKSKMSASEYEKQVNAILKELQDKFDLTDDGVMDFKIALGFTFTSDGKTQTGELLDQVKGKLKDEFDGKADELTLEELQIAAKIVADIPEGTLLSWDELQDKIKETQGNVNKMTVSLDQLKTASEGISSISSAFKQLSDDGYMSTESMSKIQEATKLSGDEWIEYQNKLMNAKAGSAEFNQVISDLTFRIIDNTFNLEELKDATDAECDAVERQIAAVLRENGVTNANAVAQSIVTQAKNGLRSTYESLTYATYEEIDALIDEGISLGYTSGQMFNLIGAHNLLNNSKLNLDDKIAVINRLGDAGLIAASKVSYLIELVNRASGALQATKNPHDLRDGDRQGAAELDLARELGVFSSWKKIDTSKIEVPAFPGVSSGGSSGGGGGSGGGSGSDSNEALDNYLKYVKHKKALGYYDDNTAQYINDLQYALNNLTKTEEEQWDLEEQIYSERENLREEEVSGYESWMSHLESLGYYEDDIAKKINDITWAIENQKLTEEEKFKKEEEIYKLTLDRNEKIRESFENLAKAHSETYNYALSDVERYIEQLEHQKALTDDEALIKSIDRAIINSMADGITKAEEAISNLTTDADYWKSEIENKLKELGASFDISKWFDYEGNITSQFESDMDVLNNSEAENVISSWANIVSEKLKSVADNTNQIFEYQEKIFSDSKEAIEESISDIKEAAEEIFELRTSKLNSQSTLLKAQHSLINSIAETQHQLDKDILEAETAGARMSEIERESLFTRDEYNKLSGKLNDVLSEANSIQDEFNRKLKGATLDTIDEITSHYERQYELKMKEYEIVKAELDVAKAQQKLENVENEKSVRQWDGEKWIYTSVLQDVIDAQNELADAKYALAQAEIEQSQTEAIQEIDSKVDSLETQKNLFITALEGLTEGTTSARERLNTALNEIADTDVSLFRNIVSSVGETLDELGAKISSISIGTPVGSSGKVKVVSGTGNGGIHPVDANFASLNNLKNAYAKGSRHTPKGIGLFDEDNLGSEVLVTKDGVLRQFNAGDTVFNSEMVQRLWDFASGNPIQWNLPNTNAYDISSYINRPEMAQPIYDNRTYFNGVEVNDADGIRIMKEFATYLKSKV